MRDNELLQVLVPLIRTNFALFGIPADTTVRQSQLPTTRGVPTGPSIFIQKIGDHKYGWPRRTHVWDDVAGEMTYTEAHKLETTFQISALSQQDPANINDVTSSDLVNSVARMLQHDVTQVALRAANVGIYRITEIRTTYFINDSDQYADNPSFDFTIIHDNIITSTQPFTEVIGCIIHPI